jgi:predicted DNA-binding transcriptional regulator AlpA
MSALNNAKVLSPQKLAEILGVDTQVLKLWRHQCEGPKYIQLSPRRICYLDVDVNTWIESRRVNGTMEGKQLFEGTNC